MPTKPDLVPHLDVSAPAVRRFNDVIMDWFSENWMQIAIGVGVGVCIYLVLVALREFGKRLRDSAGDTLGLTKVVGRALSRTTQFFLIMLSARLVVGYADPPAFLTKTIGFLFTIAAVFQVALWLREIILGLIERKTLADGQGETLANAMSLIRILVTVALFAIATIVVLDNLGVNVTGLVAGLGIGGIAIGLAAQGIFSDLFAALTIIFDQPFRRGEIISYDQTSARVEKIGLKSTRLRAVSGERKIISNANLLQKEITSLQMLARRRVTYAIGIIYQTPEDKAEAIPDILRDIVEAEGLLFINAGMIAFGASSLDYQLNFDVPDPDERDYFQMRHRIGLAIWKRFNAEGIEFAYPTQTSIAAGPDGKAIMPYPETALFGDETTQHRPS